MGTGHFGQCRRPFKTDNPMPALRECLQVAPRATSDVEDREGCRGPDVPQQRIDVLSHIVIARAFPESLGATLVMVEGSGNDVLKD
jgi:hypothetical protein